jgi:hypothetical protein
MADKPKLKPAQTRQLLQRLLAIKTRFDSSSGKRKQILIEKLSDADFRDTKSLFAYHDALSFIRAYPENKSLLQQVDVELKTFGERLEVYRDKGGDPAGVRLVNSGISHTEVHHIFSYEMARKLSSWYPGQIDIAWERIDSEPVEAIAGILPLLVCWQENDLIDNAENFDVRRWLTAAAGDSQRTTLAVLLDLMTESDLPERVQHLLYESLELPLHWQLEDSDASRTHNRVTYPRLYTQRGPLRHRSKSLTGEIRKPATALQLMPPTRGEQLVRKISEVLAVRFRELFPLTNANPGEVYLCEPGRGLQMYLFGSVPSARLPLETNFGAMFVRNGLPVGYGVAVVLFDRVEIAVNVFPAFRTGESAFLIEQFFRVFYQYFGSRIFLVRRGQLGHGDDEPLKSGAFWFYYKLGFRALNAGVRELAEHEHQKILRQKKYRCSLATLKKLSKSDVVLCTDGSATADYQEMSLIGLANAVTSLANTRFGGSRQAATKKSVRHLRRQLGIGSLSDWSDDQRTAIRAKGSVREREFIALANGHPRLKAALTEIAAAHALTQ